MADADLVTLRSPDAATLDLSAVERAAVTNEILQRALERVRSEAATELLPTAHHTHHCSHSVHSNGW
jgi:hypothetical protein